MLFTVLFMLVAAAAAEECQIACPMIWTPLCGTDGHTYANQCDMSAQNCLKKASVAVAYAGECASTHVACNDACLLNYVPVCGTDGQTYGNQCELESLSCLRKSNVAVAYAGECGSQQAACNDACQLNYSPVCGTDGQTYGNECELTSLACLRKSAVTVQHAGECGSLFAKIADEVAQCNDICLMNWVPVCGTDGATYGNQCELDSHACRKRINVQVAHVGEC